MMNNMNMFYKYYIDDEKWDIIKQTGEAIVLKGNVCS